MNTINTEALTLSLTALAVIANRLMDNNDKELFSNDARIIMAENPTQAYLKGISKGLYPNDHKRAKAFELSTFHCQWLDSNGDRATKFSKFLNDELTLSQIRILTADTLADFKAQWRASTNKPQAPVVQAPAIIYGEIVPPADTTPPADTPPADTPPADTPPADKIKFSCNFGHDTKEQANELLDTLVLTQDISVMVCMARMILAKYETSEE